MRPLLDYAIGFLNGESKENFLEVLKVYCKRGDRSGVIRLLVMMAGKDPRDNAGPRPWDSAKDHTYYVLSALVIYHKCSLSDLVPLVEFINCKGRIYNELTDDMKWYWSSQMIIGSIASHDSNIFLEFIEAYKNGYICNKEVCESNLTRRYREREERLRRKEEGFI